MDVRWRMQKLVMHLNLPAAHQTPLSFPLVTGRPAQRCASYLQHGLCPPAPSMKTSLKPPSHQRPSRNSHAHDTRFEPNFTCQVIYHLCSSI